MKTLIYFLFISLFAIPKLSQSQGGAWAFMKGDTTGNSIGVDTAVYGAMGVPSDTTMPPGIYEAPCWIDKRGKFWIFGGRTDGFTEMNNFWMYDPSTNNWTWVGGSGNVTDVNGNFGVQGVPSPTNYPGARAWGTDSWTDKNGDFWMFGGQGWDGTGNRGMLNDLWRYHIITNEWTWMSGTDTANALAVYGIYQLTAANNRPCSRYENTATWTDSSNGLWFFGGGEYPTYLGSNVMWRYDIGTNQWAWMKGPMGAGPGSYGTMGVESVNNLPPARNAYCSWQDVSGNFYLYGGFQIGVATYNDVWKYNTQTNNWTWVAGDSGINKGGHYNQLCLDNETLGPEARCENRSAKLNGGTNVFIAYGGSSPGLYGTNSVWTFNSQTYEWHWISGDTICTNNGFGKFGTPGVPSPNNFPGCTAGDAAWLDSTGVFWIFGGSARTYFESNYIWKYIPDENCSGPIITGVNYTLTENEICKGDTAFLHLIGLANAAITPLSGVTWTDSADAYIVPDSTTSYTITGSSALRNPDTAVITIYIIPAPALTVTTSANVICTGGSAEICATAGFTNYKWSTGDTTACINTQSAGAYSVTVSENGSCSAVSPPVIVSVASAALEYTLSDTAICLGDSVLLTFEADTGLIISPLTGIRWIDSLHAEIIPPTTTTYSLTGYSPCGKYDATNFVISVIQSTVTISANKTDLCPGDSAQICASTAATTYIWNTGETTACIYTQSAGNYYVTVSENGNCSAQSNQVTINVYPSSPISISINGDTLSGYFASSYQWFLNGNPIAGDTSFICIAHTSGSYTLQITDSNGCEETSNAIVISNINVINGNYISVYPNPTSSGWELSVSEDLIGSQLELFDAVGRLVFKSAIVNQKSEINIPNAASGVYELRITGKGYSVVKKLVKLWPSIYCG